MIGRQAPCFRQMGLRAGCSLHQRCSPLALRRRRIASNVANLEAADTNSLFESSLKQKQGFFYDGIVFDMDQTLIEAHIDFADMRSRTGIPVGDLFTTMEAWTDGARVKRAMDIILDIEAKAAQAMTMKEGLIKILDMLKQRKVRVGLVTRNTLSSVDAFFDLVGNSYRDVFSQVLTREFKYCKPDRRLLLHVAEVWGVEPSRLLMVGDSFEDVECGNAAGTATCLVAGGGNEKPGTNLPPPPGAVPTFAVQGLPELQRKLQEAADSEDGWASAAVGLKLGWPARVAAGEPVITAGAPPPGLGFLDWLADQDALHSAPCSFPFMGRSAGGLATSDVLGDRVLHVGCAAGGLTKLLASQGLAVVGVDGDVSAATKRGLMAVPFVGKALAAGSLQQAAQLGQFDVVMLYGQDSTSALHDACWWQSEALQEMLTVLAAEGRVCAEVPLQAGINPAAIVNSLHNSSLVATAWQLVSVQGQQHLRLVASQA